MCVKEARVIVRGTLKDEVAEVDSEDMHFIMGVSPARIERVAVSRTPALGRIELVVHVADHTKRIMISGMSTFVAVKQRRLC